MSLGSPGTAANNPLGLPLDTQGRVPSPAIGEVPKEQRDTKLRNQEGPHDVLSLAVPQPVSNKDTKATREEEPSSTAKRGLPSPEVKMEPPPAYVVEQGRQEALDTVRRHMAQPGDPVVYDDNPLRLPLDENGRAPKLKIVTIPGDEAPERIARCNNLC